MSENVKISEENLKKVKSLIEKEYGTLSDFAGILGISVQNLSNKLSRMSPKFRKELKEKGVDVSKVLSITDIYSSQLSEDNSVRVVTDKAMSENNFHAGRNIKIAGTEDDAIKYLKQISDLLAENTVLRQENTQLRGALYDCEQRIKEKRSKS